MRAFSLFTFAVAVVSALTVPFKRSNFDELEIREPAKHAVPNPIKFSQGAKKHMDNLGLAKGSQERKAVKDYHRNIVAEEMARNGAHSAQVVKLAHITGSVDTRLHITTGFWNQAENQAEKRMKTTYGDPPKKSNLFHVYADHTPVDTTYINHIHAAGKQLRRRSYDEEELEVHEPAKHAVPNAIKFSEGGKKPLDNLGLAKGSADSERKQVKEYQYHVTGPQRQEDEEHFRNPTQER